MNELIEKFLESNFEAEELVQTKEFINRGFSLNGELAVASLFLFAKENGKTVTEVLPELQKEWERNWQYQHPDIRANPDGPGESGTQNNTSLINVYTNLGIPIPTGDEQ